MLEHLASLSVLFSNYVISTNQGIDLNITSTLSHASVGILSPDLLPLLQIATPHPTIPLMCGWLSNVTWPNCIIYLLPPPSLFLNPVLESFTFPVNSMFNLLSGLHQKTRSYSWCHSLPNHLTQLNPLSRCVSAIWTYILIPTLPATSMPSTSPQSVTYISTGLQHQPPKWRKLWPHLSLW